MKLPMHAGRALIVHLHSVNPHVACAGFRIAGMHIWQGDETSAVFRPALEYRQIAQRKAAATLDFMHDLLACRVTH